VSEVSPATVATCATPAALKVSAHTRIVSRKPVLAICSRAYRPFSAAEMIDASQEQSEVSIAEGSNRDSASMVLERKTARAVLYSFCLSMPWRIVKTYDARHQGCSREMDFCTAGASPAMPWRAGGDLPKSPSPTPPQRCFKPASCGHERDLQHPVLIRDSVVRVLAAPRTRPHPGSIFANSVFFIACELKSQDKL
jgi:hypothetical protein